MMKPVIYQVFPRWFGNSCATRKQNGTIEENGCGKFADFTPSVLARLGDLGVTHVWYTGVIRHATMTDYSAYGIPRQHPAVVKGRAGSPYAIVDYYDVDPDLATDVMLRRDEFLALVRRTHDAGLKVVLDFVPNHVARQYESVAKPPHVRDFGSDDDTRQDFSPGNNFYYCKAKDFAPDFDIFAGESTPFCEHPAKATGNDRFDNAPNRNDWYETVKLNYGVDYCGDGRGHFNTLPDTWEKMLDILLFWASKGVDAFRCDMVFMVPVEFWKWVIPLVRTQYPHVVFIGEIYSPEIYSAYLSAGFDWLYDKVGMYDTLCDVICHRRHASDITYQWQSVGDMQPRMLYFLENHDEVRLASDFMAADGRRALPALIVSALLGQNPFMLYAGQEFGERGMDSEGFSGIDGRTTIFDYWFLDSLHTGYFAPESRSAEATGLLQQYRAILRLANEEQAVVGGKMFDLMYVNPALAERQFAFLRCVEVREGRRSRQELLLVVANFSDDEVSADVFIPAHAFDYLKIKAHEQVQAVDLLSGEALQTCFLADSSVSMTVPPRWGRAYKFLFDCR